MLTLYWKIGNSILEKQNQNGWGSKVIDLLASDLAKNFPDNSGFSVRNLKYMPAFAEAYPQFPIVQVSLAQTENDFVQVSLAQITWHHHIRLLAKVKYAMRGLTKPLGVASYELEQLVKENIDKLDKSEEEEK